jgi:uncharacterized protein (DUF2126 family)
MSILVGLHHATRYTYDRAVAIGPQVVRLRPSPHCRTRIRSYSVSVAPAQHFVNWQQDPHGNWLARFVFPEKSKELSVTVDLITDIEVINPFDFFVEPYADRWPFSFPPELHEDLAAFVAPEPAGPLLTDLVASVPRVERNTVDFLVELNQRLQRMIRYLIRMEPGVQTPEETLRSGAGSCRDTAWLLVQLLRHLGLPARFVSGYLIQLRPDLKPIEGAAGVEQDFTDLHAWTEVYLPGAGWIGLDPTSGLLCGEGHLPLAATPHYRSAAPISGLIEPSEVAFSFEMSVKRIAEHPRVTMPFSQQAWTELDALGEKVDADLLAQDVRLTMGGEPTFVSVDDYQSAEWNTAAVGPTKRHRADELIRRLRHRFAPGGLLHYGQGKWYPGEPLPRWAFALFWRRDGVPIWRDESLIAREAAVQNPTAEDSLHLAHGVAARLGIAADYVQPAYEDPADRMIKQGLIPDNIDPGDPKIDDPHERARILSLFDRHLSKPAGFVLPVQRWTAQAKPGWLSEVWRTRRGRIFLVPGDSPIGFRLPLQSLPYVAPVEYPHLLPADLFGESKPLPDPRVTHPIGAYALRTSAGADASPPLAPETLIMQRPAAPGVAGMPVRTALVVEVRDGRLCVFMPPDARMSLAQQLLLRALVATFWRTPLDAKLVRWGTILHDRYMLEHFVWGDFLEVLDDLARGGYAFDPAWFEAQRQFRFPLCGAVEHAGVRLELRQAIEPWHVLGEEGMAGGTVRLVDSSIERLQVKVDGLIDNRHVITCNGARLPLTSTGRSGAFVAGVRFKAWNLASGLHPTIPVQAPLTLDIVDTWSSRSLGGCVYHVAHPGGRNYDTYPVNSYEAEARRRARFADHGHTPGPIDVPPLDVSLEYPVTLDLRRAIQ